MTDKFLQFLSIAKKAGKLLEGYNKCEDGINKDKVHLILISKDTSENTVNKFKNYCTKNNVPYLIGYDKYTLGNSLGRSEISILGITDKKIYVNLIKLWNQGENI